MKRKLREIVREWIYREPELALSNYSELARRIVAEDAGAAGYSWRWVRQEIGHAVTLPQHATELQRLVREAAGAASQKAGEEEAPKKRRFQAGETVSRQELMGQTAEIVEDAYERRFVVTPDGDYAIEVQGQIRFFPIGMVDQLFKYYSRHGYNYTSTQVQHEFELDPATFHAIKNAFRLYKESHVFSPYTWEHTPEEEREAMVEEVVRQVMGSHKVTERVYRTQLERHYKRAIRRSHLVTANHHRFLAELSERLPQVRQDLVISYTPPHIIMPREEVLAAVTDLHTGAFVMGLGLMPDFTTEVLRRRLSELAYFINSLRARRVKLAFLGDSIESFTGMNHPNSWQGIEQGVYGANVVILAYEVILEFVEQVYNVTEIAAVGGNHDRSTSSGKEDAKAEIATLLFYFIGKRLHETGVRVIYDNDTVSVPVGTHLNAILQHGHNGNARVPMGNTLWDYGIKGRFNFILQGHLHSRILKPNDDSLDGRRIICPSMFTGNDYSRKAGFSPSLAGAIVIEEDAQGLPLVLDKSFK